MLLNIKELFSQRDANIELTDDGSHTELSTADIKDILRCGIEGEECLSDVDLRAKLCN